MRLIVLVASVQVTDWFRGYADGAKDLLLWNASTSENLV